MLNFKEIGLSNLPRILTTSRSMFFLSDITEDQVRTYYRTFVTRGSIHDKTNLGKRYANFIFVQYSSKRSRVRNNLDTLWSICIDVTINPIYICP